MPQALLEEVKQSEGRILLFVMNSPDCEAGKTDGAMDR